MTGKNSNQETITWFVEYAHEMINKRITDHLNNHLNNKIT